MNAAEAQTATRQIEMNEWAYQNKLDSLFILQILFISLLFLSLLFYFKAVGLLGSAFVWYTFAVVFLVVGLIVINRAVISQRRRDGRVWSRRRFDGDQALPSPVSPTETDYQNYVNRVTTKYPASK